MKDNDLALHVPEELEQAFRAEGARVCLVKRGSGLERRTAALHFCSPMWNVMRDGSGGQMCGFSAGEDSGTRLGLSHMDRQTHSPRRPKATARVLG